MVIRYTGMDGSPAALNQTGEAPLLPNLTRANLAEALNCLMSSVNCARSMLVSAPIQSNASSIHPNRENVPLPVAPSFNSLSTVERSKLEISSSRISLRPIHEDTRLFFDAARQGSEVSATLSGQESSASLSHAQVPDLRPNAANGSVLVGKVDIKRAAHQLQVAVELSHLDAQPMMAGADGKRSLQ